MLVVAITKPIRYRWPGGEARLVPGKPVDLPEDRAKRLLKKAAGKVRVVGALFRAPGACMTCGSTRFWLSVHEKLVCGICHPPASPTLVREWLWDGL
jgi:hypothetical protein